jgi:hypothetical protein
MRLNQIGPESVQKVSDRELLALHFRMHQLASPYLKQAEYEDPSFKNLVLRHRILALEMIRRGIRFRIVDELDRRAAPDIIPFLEKFSKLIPSRLGDLTKADLIKLHNQVHSVWEVIHATDVSITQQEQLWNWHKLIIRELENRGIDHPTNWDSLDQPLGRALGSPNMYPSGEGNGNWMFVEDIIPKIPSEIVVERQIVLIDTEQKLIYLNDVGGRQLVKVMYFRILRQFPRQDWSSFKTASLDQIGSIDVSYDLVLKKLEPLWTVQLSMQFSDLCLVKPYLYIVGGIVTQGASKNDIDILLRGGLDPKLEDKIFSTFVQQFPEQLRGRFSQLRDEGLGPYTSYIGAASLELVQPSHEEGF